MSEINDKIQTLEEQALSFNDKILNLQNQIDATDISVLKQDVTNLKKQIPINKIIWDIAPKRTLKQVLGNIDNIPSPYHTLREWIEHLGGSTSGGGATINGAVWETIPITADKLKEVNYNNDTQMRYISHLGSLTDATFTIQQVPCLCIIRCFFIPIDNQNYNILGGDMDILSTPSINWTAIDETVSYEDNESTKSYTAKTFYAKITEAGEYTIDFSNPYYYVTTEQNTNYTNYWIQIFSISGYDKITKLESNVISSSPINLTNAANKDIIYFFYSQNSMINLSYPPYDSYAQNNIFKTAYYEKNINDISLNGTINNYTANSSYYSKFELQ